MLFKPCLPTRPRARWIHRAFLPDGLADNQTRHHTSVFSFWALDSRSFFLLNQAYMVLLRKKEDAMNIRDFRPISLIHSFSKLIAKVLSNQLVPFMPRLVAPNQSGEDNTRQFLHSSLGSQTFACPGAPGLASQSRFGEGLRLG
jgi:hypothetical protein